MAKFKNLLKKSSNIGLSALLTVSALLPILGAIPTKSSEVAAATATTGVGTINPGTSWDTGNHNYSSQLATASNYAVTGNNSPAINGNWLNLVNGGKAALGYGTFKGALNATSGFTLSATAKLENTATLGADWAKTGASLGFVLTSASVNQLENNTNNGQSSGLGIKGLPNTIFAGRDLYSDLHSYDSSGNYQGTGPDGTAGVNSWTDGAGTVIAIRRTLSSGSLDPAAYPSLGSSTSPINNVDGQAYSLAADDGYVTGVNTGRAGTAQQPVKLTWTPDATNTASSGYVSGTLTFNLVAQTTSNGLPSGLGGASVNGGTSGYTISAKENLPASVTVGFVASSGSSITATDSTNANTGNLSLSLNGATSSAARGQENVVVNYINSATGKKISTLADGKTIAKSSTVTANVYDRVAIAAPGGTASSPTTTTLQDTYKYVAPAASTFAGYSAYSKVTYGGTFDSSGKLTGDVATDPNDSTNTNNANGLTVANYDSSATNPNVINIYYTPNAQTTYWNYGHAYKQSTAPTPSYPSTPSSQSGSTGVAYTAATLPAAPAGYHYAGVKYYDANAAAVRTFWTSDALGWTSATANTPPTAQTNSFTGYSGIAAAVTAAVSDANSENNGMLPGSLTSPPANDASLGSTEPNVFTTYLEADKITANFTFGWAGGTTPANAPTLPSNTSTSGAYTTAITGAPTYTAPTGYTTSVAVTSTNASGTTTTNTYPDLATALSKNSTYAGTTAKPMTFAVTVSANQNQVNFNYQWAKGTPGATDSGATTANPGKLQGSLPANSTITAGTGSPLTSMSANWLPAGYGVQSVATPDGNTWTSFTYSGTTITLKDANGNTKTGTASSAPSDLYLAARAVYPTVSSAATQNWTVTVNALTQSPNLTAYFNTGPSAVTPISVNFQDASGNQWTALTGSQIPSNIISATDSALKTKLQSSSAIVYSNWVLAHYADPNGNYDTSHPTDFASTVNLSTGANGYVIGGDASNTSTTSNAYKVMYDYAGALTFSYPKNINFGSHKITGQDLTGAVGSLEDASGNSQAAVVADYRNTPTDGSKLTWTLQVAQTSVLTNAIGIQLPASDLTFNGTAMTLGTPVTVASDDNSSTGKITTALAANSSAFKLNVPISAQIANSSYSGKVTWTLTQAP